jgi:hypothetical protein
MRLLVLAALLWAPTAQTLNVAGIKAAGDAVTKGTSEVHAPSGIRAATSVAEKVADCIALRKIDSLTGNACLEGIQQELALSRDLQASRIAELRYRNDVFAWQLFSSKVVFVVVLAVVFTGLAFSGIQFYLDYRVKTMPLPPVTAAAKISVPSTADAVTDTKPVTTTVEISKDKIMISSPVLGVIVLAMSITFLYLYLQYIYPIHEL